MIHVIVPAYGWRLTRDLYRYLQTTVVVDPWKNGKQITKQFKKEVTRCLLVAQSKRCAYCGSRLYEKHPHRDHIAPKGTYPEWTFWPENLVLSCSTCNTDIKGSYDPVDVRGKTYRTTTFKFVHPYLDNPSAHFEYVPGGKALLIYAKQGSAKGQKSIDLFDLASIDRALQRAKDYLHDEDCTHLHGAPFRELMENALEALNKNYQLITRAGI